MASKRIEWLDSLRGVAMLAVVLGHVSSISKTMDTLIYSFHMPLFFMISGAVFRVGKYDTLKACVVDKAKKLLLPYVFLYWINAPFWYLNKKILGTSSAPLTDLVIGFFSATQNIGTMTSGALWFLPCLFLVSVLVAGRPRSTRKGQARGEHDSRFPRRAVSGDVL